MNNNNEEFRQNINMNMSNNNMIILNNNMNNMNMPNVNMNNSYMNNQNNIDLLNLFANQESMKYIKELELDDETYILTLKKENNSQLSISLENELDFLSLYNYSITLSYDDFCKLGKSFRLFDNIDEIFNIIKKLLNGVEFSFRKDNDMPAQMNQNYQQNRNVNNNMRMMSNMNNYNQMMNNRQMINNDNIDKVCSNIRLVYPNSNSDSICIVLNIPLLNEKYETVCIKLKGEIKDIKTQYEKLKKKYLNIMNIAFPKKTSIQNNNMGNPMISKSHFVGVLGLNNNFNMNNPNNHDSFTILEKIKNELKSNI